MELFSVNGANSVFVRACVCVCVFCVPSASCVCEVCSLSERVYFDIVSRCRGVGGVTRERQLL